MKSKKFKLEKSVVEEVRKSLYSYSLRAKLLSSYITENYIRESFYNILLVKYQNVILSYNSELIDIAFNGNYCFITEQQLEKINSYKKILNGYEEEINNSNIFNLKVH